MAKQTLQDIRDELRRSAQKPQELKRTEFFSSLNKTFNISFPGLNAAPPKPLAVQPTLSENSAFLAPRKGGTTFRKLSKIVSTVTNNLNKRNCFAAVPRSLKEAREMGLLKPSSKSRKREVSQEKELHVPSKRFKPSTLATDDQTMDVASGGEVGTKTNGVNPEVKRDAVESDDVLVKNNIEHFEPTVQNSQAAVEVDLVSKHDLLDSFTDCDSTLATGDQALNDVCKGEVDTETSAKNFNGSSAECQTFNQMDQLGKVEKHKEVFTNMNVDNCGASSDVALSVFQNECGSELATSGCTADVKNNVKADTEFIDYQQQTAEEILHSSMFYAAVMKRNAARKRFSLRESNEFTR